VAATASLLLTKNPNLPNWLLEDILLGTAKERKGPGWDGLTGAGSLDAAKALRFNLFDLFVVKLTELKVNRQGSKVSSMDVFGSVHGDVEEFRVELGKGKDPSKWQPVGGPYRQLAHYNWLCRIGEEKLRGSKEWSVRITAADKKGRTSTAESVAEFK